VKDLFDNVVLCALEGQAESRTAATTTTAPTVQATPPGQRTTAEETKKGKEKANDNDEAENEVQPDEGKFTRPGLSTDEKGTNLSMSCARAGGRVGEQVVCRAAFFQLTALTEQRSGRTSTTGTCSEWRIGIRC
jgi:hypothetical protein